MGIIFKNKSSAKEIEKSITAVFPMAKPFILNVFAASGGTIFNGVNRKAFADSLLKHVESKLDCEEYFATFEDVMGKNVKSTNAFFAGQMERSLMLLATGGDDSEPTPKLLADAFDGEVRLCVALFKMILQIFSEAPKDCIVMLLEHIEKVSLKEMFGDSKVLSEDEIAKLEKAQTFPLNRGKLDDASKIFIKLFQKK